MIPRSAITVHNEPPSAANKRVNDLRMQLTGATGVFMIGLYIGP